MRELYVGFLLFLLTFLYLSHLKREAGEARSGHAGIEETIRKAPPVAKKLRHG